MEEVTETNILNLIRSLPDKCRPIERIIITNTGTVQTLLSVLFKNPIRVKVISQTEGVNCYIREVQLLLLVNGKEVVVCTASSIIYLNKQGRYQGFYTGIKEKNMGIGQLLSSLKIPTEREIISYNLTKNIISRTYFIRDIIDLKESEHNIVIEITEHFVRKYFVNTKINNYKLW